jgi:serine phosphatase RsbU (regulator of sigma subunit)
VDRLRLRFRPPEAEPFVRECAGPTVVLGRSSKADVVIPDRFLSRLHARLVRRQDGWYLEDLGSRNTTFLNGQAVTGPTRLSPGDVVRLAGTTVDIAPAAEGPEPELDHGMSVFRPVSTILAVREAPAVPTAEGPLGRQTSRLRLVNEVHRALARPITLEALLELILDTAFEHLRPEEGAIFLRGAEDRFERAASRRLPGATGEPLYSRRLIQEVTEKGMAALVLDAAADERFAKAESIIAAGMRSIVAAPLLDEEGCTGLIVLGSRLSVRRFSEDDMELLVSLAAAAALRIRNLAYAEEAAQRRLLDKELALAHEIQMAMLPKVFPHRAEFELAAALRPAKSVGGDLYDFLLEGDRLWFLIGDVSGKGMGAALFMAVAKTLFHAIVPGAHSLGAVLSRVNHELCRDNEQSLFVTAFVGRLDLGSGEMEFGNAGHSPPYLLRADGSVEELASAPQVALGVVSDHLYATGRTALAAGDALFLYTDGVVDELNPAGEQFSDERLRAHLEREAHSPVGPLVEGTMAVVQDFAGGRPQSDDVAVMAVRYRTGDVVCPHGRGVPRVDRDDDPR